MAYMSQENKKAIAAAVKPILKKYGVKGTFSTPTGSTICLNIKAGKIDFGGEETINPYHYQKHFTGKALAFLNEVFPLLNKGNHDNSDIQSDYFDVGWYVSVHIGKWNKPYVLVK